MKKILGLDLGTTSIGWALVNEKENDNEHPNGIQKKSEWLRMKIMQLTTCIGFSQTTWNMKL